MSPRPRPHPHPHPHRRTTSWLLVLGAATLLAACGARAGRVGESPAAPARAPFATTASDSAPGSSSEAPAASASPATQAAPGSGSSNPLTAAAPLPVTSALGTCRPAVQLAPPNAFADDGIPDAEEVPMPDLDGDGVADVQVTYPASFQERGTIVALREPPPSCYRVVYDGVGTGASPRKGSVRAGSGRSLPDLSLFLTPITSRGRGSAIAVARYDGRRYQLDRIESCRGIDGTPIPRRECAALIDSYRPELPPPPPSSASGR